MEDNNASRWRSSPKGPLPIVIGVTGHRDIVIDDTLKKGVLDVFDFIKGLCPHTPLIVLSPLASGADQFVADLALKSGLKLMAPLPMPYDIYKTDFKDNGEKREFERLLHQAELRIELPLREGFRNEDVAEGSEGRNYQYARCGAYIVQHCHFLIALWDGLRSSSVGGTGHIVPFMLEGVPEPYDPSYSPIDHPDTGPVCHVTTSRQQTNAAIEDDGYHEQFPKTYPATNSARGRFLVQEKGGDQTSNFHIDYPKIYPDAAAAEESFGRLFHRVEAFNRDALHVKDKEREASKKSLHPEDGLCPDIDSIREHYSYADSLANKYHAATNRTLRLLGFSILVAAFFFELYTHRLLTFHNIFFGYVAFFIVARCIFLYAKWDDRQNKHQDYRALAEGLRVQFFWRLAGLEDSVADYYLRKQRSEMDWIPKAIRVWNIRTARTPDLPGANPKWTDVMEVLQQWVKGQAHYFQAASNRDNPIRKLFTVNVLVTLSFYLALFYMFILAIESSHDYASLTDKLGSHWILFVSGAFAVAAALLHWYVDKRALPEHVKQYRRMSELFQHAASRLEEFIKAENASKAYRLLIELGKEALIEHGDWLFLHRERPLEVPHK
jgi:hypothetical protein